MPSKIPDIEQYHINISNGYNFQQLKLNWLAIEDKADVPFLLSWAWVSTWIKIYSPTFQVITAELNNEVIAIALMTSSIERRHFVINSKQLRLHQTGLQSQDQIWVEYNDFIALDEHKEKAVNACLKYLIKHKIFNSHDEIIISMILENRAKSIVKTTPNSEILFTRPSFKVDLEHIKSQNSNYLQTLKSNTRYQIRRSMRHYEKSHGSLKLIHTHSPSEAIEFFDATAPFHIERWYDSGFKNSDFIDFHHQLIKSNYQAGRIHLIKVNAGDTTIAILYYLIKNMTVSFYLQGLLYEQSKTLKPGLVAHSLATQYFMDKGMKVYDYMGGNSQYKKQLANRSEDFATIRIQKPILKFIFENTAQTLKNVMTRKK